MDESRLELKKKRKEGDLVLETGKRFRSQKKYRREFSYDKKNSYNNQNSIRKQPEYYTNRKQI